MPLMPFSGRSLSFGQYLRGSYLQQESCGRNPAPGRCAHRLVKWKGTKSGGLPSICLWRSDAPLFHGHRHGSASCRIPRALHCPVGHCLGKDCHQRGPFPTRSYVAGSRLRTSHVVGRGGCMRFMSRRIRTALEPIGCPSPRLFAAIGIIVCKPFAVHPYKPYGRSNSTWSS
ncbi:hypothetical protein M440DRAFT_1102988 [Trichoderma longibrachiatum ATCC 18648]|uniref:Uncharacterized protein n=1 Tax=Trichoderma longibrachiatum ATCC 18648 TaxID=983965 RepID=A0A2T4BRP2_TRILO|nr:hypothetical protein M440DRAFT_1102988 [Trichoderma longibrachiatum ATCC 18648]